MRHVRGVVCLLAVVAAAVSADPGHGSSSRAKNGYTYRLVYVIRNLSADSHVAAVARIAKQAHDNGYTGLVLDASFDRIDLREPAFFSRLESVAAICRRFDLDLIPHVGVTGYAMPMLQHDPNLAGAVPVRGALFVVQDGVATLRPDPDIALPGGGFEEESGVHFRDKPGSISFVDRTMRRSGAASLRIEDPVRNEGKGRVFFDVAVRPFRCYRLTCFVRNEGSTRPSPFRIHVQGRNGRVLMTCDHDDIGADQWRQVVSGFNSLENDTVRLHLGVWQGSEGRMWIDDVRVEEVGLLNVLRREGTPLVVRSESTGVVYEEGVDFDVVTDTNLDFLFTHEPPAIHVRSAGAIAEGERLRVDFYQTYALKNMQVGVCPSGSLVDGIMRTVIARVDDVIRPSAYFLGVDEWRHGGWCQTCEASGLSGGELIASAIGRLQRIVTERRPGVEVFVWSDMLDPFANATPGPYYLFKGSLAESWRTAREDLVVASWNQENPGASLAHFSQLGFRTIACGYYDQDTLERSAEWAALLPEIPGAAGFMYTTWRDDYGSLETFARLFEKD